ncbi:tetraacyldisaccharide 4'-kinase [Spirosoma utsteinense]|nr:tetraacyldisaccharide 4'-kinase [Spirosoma utsteinense]
MKHSAFTWLLKPLSRIYGFITEIRNWLYDNGLFAKYHPDIFTVSVGNLTVGGTGKTPMIEYLIKRHLNREASTTAGTVTLSRGYGRHTKGFRVASTADTAATIGDEPLQLYRKFGQQIQVCVGERRADAIKAIQARFPATRRILLDDAFQHRAVSPDLNLLLMDFNRPFYTDYPFPAGRLRENRNGAQRADALIITKCPVDLPLADQRLIEERARQYTRPQIPVFFAGLRYDQPTAFATLQPVTGLADVVLVSGLANADPLEQYVQQQFVMHHHHRFADHRVYSRSDFDRLLAGLASGVSLLTTEKDWVKLDALLSPAERATLPLFFLPVQMVLLGEHDRAFNQFLDTATLKIR